MNITKGDVQELRRRLKKTECTFGRMCGCYVNSGKQVVLKFGEQFSELEEDEFYKYLEIAKKTLSGTGRQPARAGIRARGAGGRVPLVPAHAQGQQAGQRRPARPPV